jgi:hypothetical protein
MEIGEQNVVVQHVGKRVIMDSEKQICRWVCLTKIL